MKFFANLKSMKKLILANNMGRPGPDLGGINAAGPADGRGIIVNCPIVFVPDDAR